MPKLLWVLLPLLAVAVLLALLRLRRRAPSRLALNIGFSLLLLAYVATTAGLGIFWVAKQQLPVFDWHYLFGYATLLLLLLHLVFNLPVVWRFLRRRSAGALPTAASAAAPPITATAAPPLMATPAAPPRRRLALGLGGAALTGGLAYWLGLRHGRDAAPQGLQPEAAHRVSDSAAAMAQVERFQALSSNLRAGVLLQAPGVDWGDAPAPFKQYSRAARIVLPAPRAKAVAQAPDFDLEALATLLWHTVGVTERRGAIALRASPSSGALFATELYVAARAVHGLAPGLWHYDALAHALERLSDTPPDDAQALGAAGAASLHDATALVVATAVFRRSGHKYRDRTYRYVLADLGHALENLRVAALAHGAPCEFVLRFDEARCAATLGVDQAEEGVLALLALRPGQAGAPRPALRAASAASAGPAAPAAAATRLGITGQMHAATSLRAAPAAPSVALPSPPAADAIGTMPRPGAPAAALPSPAAADATGAIPLPPAPVPSADVLRLIAVRRSQRRFADRPVAREALSGVLAAMSAPETLSQALRIDVVLNAVPALPSGAFRYDAQQHALVPRRAGIDLRRAAHSAALDQDVIGDAAVVFVLSLDRAALAADPVGALRGYRHALLQAGMAGERIYLAAQARGLGCCAVGAFFDDEASALVGADPAREWVVHFAALGVPG